MSERHRCTDPGWPDRGYGPALTESYEDDAGALWVTNHEYASQVAFCPYCGFRAAIAPVARQAGS